ncbi:TetR/AcrR family transcriptional regulator [Antrihabitans sp. YC2-6]|uniref:TetR/AcrR family transcriptional regulator n=1 Tax=Antrihabitans sp. YC2-6 TaxID=2799498 RepID=UPI0027DABBBA|nr:TetR/AcrR family transcriptional regulator [Antrihabitans sp. YC2-6]
MSRGAVEDDNSDASAQGAERRAGALSRRVILDAATEMIDQQGVQQLTMRRLGTWCGVEAMALYRYVSGREDLLTGVVDNIIDTLYEDQLASRESEDGGWQDYLQRVAHGVRRIALDHPQLFPAIATRPPEAPWVRPPLRSLKWMETFLATLRGFGFEREAAVAVYRSFTTFLLGQLLLEVAALGAPLSPAQDAIDGGAPAPLDLRKYPNLLELAPMLAEDHSLAEFEESLEDLLDRIESNFPAP